jgi:hypothetical protein
MGGGSGGMALNHTIEVLESKLYAIADKQRPCIKQVSVSYAYRSKTEYQNIL